MAFVYKKNLLKLIQKGKEIDLNSLAKKYQTPFYIYDLGSILNRIKLFKTNCPKLKLFYAVKANDHPTLLKKLSKHTGADVVSLGEIKKCLKAGFLPKNIIFSGVAKTKKEIKEAIKLGIFRLNVESLPELERIKTLSSGMKKKVNIVLRVNPDVDAKTHPYITTGLKENKFGIEMSDLDKALDLIDSPYMTFKGLSFHIGSQITDISPFKDSFKKIYTIYKKLKKKYPEIDTLNIGGGLGINYEKEDLDKEEKVIKNYLKEVTKNFKDFKGVLIAEPGRILLASFGVLISEVEYIKKTSHKNFLILNTGMHHLIRPALYKAFHRITPLVLKKGKKETYDIVGPICESGDFLGKNRKLSFVEEGDKICIFDAGAYGSVMSLTYNSRESLKEIFFEKGRKL